MQPRRFNGHTVAVNYIIEIQYPFMPLIRTAFILTSETKTHSVSHTNLSTARKSNLV